MTAMTLAAILLFAGDSATSPAPMTAKQVAKVRELVQRTQQQQTRIKTALTKAQRDLANAYSRYELDEPAIEKLQKQIVDLQSDLLASHHAMQKGLRQVVSPERFALLHRRIENALRTTSEPNDKPVAKPNATTD